MPASAKPTSSEQLQIQELQIRLRLLDNDRKSYAEKVTNQIRRQNGQIERLRKEREKLEAQVADESTPLLVTKTANTASNLLNTALREESTAAKQLSHFENRNSDLDKQIKVIRTKIAEERRRLSRLERSKRTPEDIERQTRILENRLNKATVRYNEAVALNKKLREEIDGLRRERSIYDTTYQKLEQRAQQVKDSLRTLVDQSNLEYDERDSIQASLAALEKAEVEEAKLFDKEWGEVTRQLEQDKHLRDLLEPGDNSSNEVQPMSLKDRLFKFANSNNTAKDNGIKISTYEEAFAKMKAATGIDSVSELVKQFVDAEVKNYSLFNYSNELGIQLDKLQAEVAGLRDALSKVSTEETVNDNKRRKLVDELEDQVENYLSKTEQYHQTYASSLASLSSFKTAVSECLEKLLIPCSEIDNVTMGEGVTDSTLLACIGLIEHRCSRVVAHYLYLHPSARVMTADSLIKLHARRDSAWNRIQDSSRLDSRDSPRLIDASSISIIPPSTDFLSDEDDENEVESRPLTRDEIRMRVDREVRG
ncbi:hypothetical protein RCL1_004347 [Eukaryota sp. TZLM3-RCL]